MGGRFALNASPANILESSQNQTLGLDRSQRLNPVPVIHASRRFREPPAKRLRGAVTISRVILRAASARAEAAPLEALGATHRVQICPLIEDEDDDENDYDRLLASLGSRTGFRRRQGRVNRGRIRSELGLGFFEFVRQFLVVRIQLERLLPIHLSFARLT
jgi:hypothetical protein